MPKSGHLKECTEDCPRFALGITSPCLRGIGPKDAKIVLIGEAPGQYEDKKGDPFIGPSGRLLNKLLGDVGLRRDDVFITNAVKCATPGENQSPTKKEIKCCRPYLQKEIERINPVVIGALGGKAMEALLDRTGIRTLKNNVFVSKTFGDVKVVPIFHPAHALRNPGVYQDLEKGFKVLLRESESRKLNISKKNTKYIIADTEEKINKVLSTLEKADKFSFDFETEHLHYFSARILSIGLSWKEQTGVTIPWNALSPSQMERLQKIFLDESKLKIAQNLKFDLEVARANKFRVKKPWTDTMLMHHLLDENRKHGLDVLTLEYTDMGEYWAVLDAFRKDYCRENKIKKEEFTYDKFPKDMLYAYGARDADATFRLYNEFEPRIKEEELEDLYNNYVIPYMDMLIEMEFRGIAIDREHLQELIVEATKKKEEMEKAIETKEDVLEYEEWRRKKATEKIKKKYDKSKIIKTRYPEFSDYVKKDLKEKDWKFNMASFKQLGELFFVLPNRKPIKLTEKKAISVDESVLNTLAEENVEMAVTITEYRKLVKYRSTYLVSTYEGSEYDGRIHPNILQHGTVTGRLSSALHTIPRDAKDFKKSFVADPGFVFVKADLAQAEFRGWAHYADDEDMIADIESGMDIHRRVASEVYGVPEEEVTSEQRSAAKNAVFGLVFGRGSAAIALQYGISVEMADSFKELFFSWYPKASQWLQKQKIKVQAQEYVKSWLGRVRRLPDIRSDNHEVAAEAGRQAINSPIQSLSSDMNNHYMLCSIKKARSQKIHCYPALPVHDANFIQVKEDQSDDLMAVMKDVVRDEFPNFRCKMVLDFEVGKTFGTLKGMN